MHKSTIIFALSIAVVAGLFLGTNNEAIASSDKTYTSTDTTIILIKN